MTGFEPVTLSWQGQAHTVEAERLLGLVGAIEEVLRGPNGEPAVTILMRKGGPGYVPLARAYAAALRYAGALVSDEEVYLTIQEDFASGDSGAVIRVQQSVLALLQIISPPLAMRLSDGGPKAKKKPPAQRPRRKA